MGHANCVVIGDVTPDISTEFGQCEATDNCLVGLWGTVAPPVITIKTTILILVLKVLKRAGCPKI